jgi:hypothetical protein
MSVEHLAISVRGQSVIVPATSVDGLTVVVNGRFPRVASIADEAWVENAFPRDPAQFIAGLAASPLRADIVTFAQTIDDPKPAYRYPFEWDNVAAIDTREFARWWDQLPQATRKNCRRSERRGAHTDVMTLDEDLAAGIKRIYDESPIRQGRRFWHYGKDVATVWRENSTYLDRCVFVGTRVGGELIGFIKVVFVGRHAKIMQILSLASHADKRPMNALLAKAVEVCCQHGMTHLIYSKFQYGNNNESSMIEFKIRNGFQRIDFPRYFVPLTLRGRLALACRLHKPLIEVLPAPVLNMLMRIRESANARENGSARPQQQTEAE